MAKRIDYVLTMLCLIGCAQAPTADDPAVIQKIDSFEKIEREISSIKQNIQIPDAKERVYYDLFQERDEILRIAEGRYQNQSAIDQSLIRKMAWIVLGEIHTRRPGFDIIVERAEHKPQAETTLPEDFK